MFYVKYQHSAVKYENACTILQTRLKKPHNFKQSRNCVAFWKTWRRVWDSNPRALSDNCISSAARYDHFDNSPNQCIRIVKSNDDTTLCIISHFTKKSEMSLRKNSKIFFFRKVLEYEKLLCKFVTPHQNHADHLLQLCDIDNADLDFFDALSDSGKQFRQQRQWFSGGNCGFHRRNPDHQRNHSVSSFY